MEDKEYEDLYFWLGQEAEQFLQKKRMKEQKDDNYYRIEYYDGGVHEGQS